MAEQKKASGVPIVDFDLDPAVDLSDPIVAEGKKRFERCVEWESPSRERFVDDIRFENGDPDNGYQWPNAIRRTREVGQKPCLTVNLIQQHNFQVSNSARKNKSSVKFKPQGNGATIESARMMSNIARRIENRSHAQDAYTLGRNFQIGGGIGWWRIRTDYCKPDSMDQDIWIDPILDPLSVYMDPDIKQKNGSDAKFAFVFDDVPKEQFDAEYPEVKDLVGGTNPMGIGGGDDWVAQDHVRVCEYFRKVAKDDEVVSFVWQGVRQTVLRSKLPSNVAKRVLADPLTKTRPTQIESIEWYLIAGNQVIDSTVWPGRYIPLVRCVGIEYTIDGLMDRKGHTRSMKDAQRMLNYNASAQVEFVALQSKTPWVAPAQAIEEYESYWNTANTANHSVLPYNAIDDEGNKIAPPMRQEPPSASPAYQMGMETAFNQIMMVSGQWQNQMGMLGNERTGEAIKSRLAQSETSVFHFQDNYEIALTFTAEIILDLVPKIYDTKRVIMVQAENEEDIEVKIDPSARAAYQEEISNEGLVVGHIFNPSLGEYSIAPSVGPAYGSKLEQTTEALTLILTQAPTLVPIIGDLVLSSMDFDKAQEAAQRLRRLVPPQALGTGPSQQEMALGQQNQALKANLSESLQKQGELELKLVGKSQMRDIDAYKAQTDRIKALQEQLPLDPDGIMELLTQLVSDAMQTQLAPLVQANQDDLDVDGAPSATPAGAGAPPLAGARRAPDGQWYVPHPAATGRYLKVVPNGRK